MKNRITTLSVAALVFSFLTFQASAQTKVWSIGPEIGVNISKYGMDAPTNKFKPGLLAGLFVTYSIQNTFGITGKVLYSEKGAKINDTKTNLQYIEVPLIARFFFNKEGNFRPNIFVGPSLGFLTGVSNKIGSGNATKFTDYKATFNTFDFGVTAGLGFNFVIANETRFLIDARYTHGLTDITKDATKVNNQAIGITAGVSFGF